MRALTTATGMLRRKQPLSRLGQNSVSARMSRRGLEGVQIGADGPGQVERAIEDAVGAEALAGQGLAGAGGGGDEDLNIREGAVELVDQAADGQHFADRDGMEPDDGAPCGLACAAMARHTSQPFGQSFAIFVRGGHAPQPPGRAGDQDREQRKIVEKQNHA